MARKYYNTKYYPLTKKLEVKCQTKNTKYGFRHVAEIVEIPSYEIVGYAKSCYYNRTWEKYDYQSVIHNAIDDCGLIKQKTRIKNKVDKIGGDATESHFKSIAMVAKIGGVFTDNKKECNNWKARMIKAGLGEGIQMPNGWNELSENEKESRLNKVIGLMG